MVLEISLIRANLAQIIKKKNLYLIKKMRKKQRIFRKFEKILRKFYTILNEV